MTERSAESGPLRWGWIVTGLFAFFAILFAPLGGDLPPAAQRLAAVSVLMAIWWMSQPIPIAVTSLLPLALYPLLGILPVKDVSQAYGDQNIFLFLGGFLIAIAIERWNLHRRIALHIINLLGTSPRRMIFGFMLTTALLSMWISNTASALLMLPISLALISTLSDALDRVRPGAGAERTGPLIVPLLLGIAYSASCGGFATLIGTPPNIILRGFWERQYVSQGYPELEFAAWMMLFVPVSLLMLLSAVALMTVHIKPIPELAELSKDFFRERLQELGRPSGSEWRLLILFSSTALLWILRKPLIIDGQVWLPDWPGVIVRLLAACGVNAEFLLQIEDSTIAIAMACLLFLLPGDRDALGFRPALLNWNEAQKRVPWGMLLLFGGGFAMAGAFSATGLSVWIGSSFSQWFSGGSAPVLIVSVSFLLTFLTEFTSNAATVNTVLPILAAMADQLQIDPRLLLIPATVSASCAFMLPVATPPNAIVFSTGKVPIGAMVRYGLALNLVGVVVISAAVYFLGPRLMGLTMP